MYCTRTLLVVLTVFAPMVITILVYTLYPGTLSFTKTQWAKSQKHFWTSDLHDGCSIDFPSMLISQGNQFFNMRTKRGGGPYPEYIAMMKTTDYPLSNIIDRFSTHQSQSDLTDKDMREFFDYYKSTPIMAQTDAFLCMFPSSICEMFMPFNRSIIILAAHRFLMGRCKPGAGKLLIQHMQQLMDHKPGMARNFIGAIDAYDKEYIKYYTGLDIPLVQSLSIEYTKGRTVFTQSRSEILLGPLQVHASPLTVAMQDAAIAMGTAWTFKTVKGIYGRFELQDIANHRAAVLLPYAVMSYGLTELYALGIPLFVPDVPFLMQIGTMVDTQMHDSFYCGAGFQDPPQHPSSTHPFSPETRDPAAVAYWLQFADFYTWPHVTQFSSWDDLITKLNAADFTAIHKTMVATNEVRYNVVSEQLRDIASLVETNRDVPQNYDEAITELWGQRAPFLLH